MTSDVMEPHISTDEFKAAFRKHPSGVAVLTATAGGEHAAMTMSSLFSLSAEPPLMCFSVSDQSSTAQVFNAARSAIIHLVDADSLWLAKLGATSGVTRFEDPTQWTELGTGERYFPGAPTIVRVELVDRLRAGTSTLCVARALELIRHQVTEADRSEPAPVVYYNRTWHRLGVASVAD